jgi:ferredoxin
MPTITVAGQSAEVAAGTRLVNAIEDMGVHIGHRCGGQARCTTCRVTFTSGEPEMMTAAEFGKLKERGMYGEARLSCQIVCDHDMACEPVMTLENQEGWTDTGPRTDDAVQPAAEFFPKSELEAKQA